MRNRNTNFTSEPRNLEGEGRRRRRRGGGRRRM
jgi:hypothetical protein